MSFTFDYSKLQGRGRGGYGLERGDGRGSVITSRGGFSSGLGRGRRTLMDDEEGDLGGIDYEEEQVKPATGAASGDDEIDPLDAFMQGVEKEVQGKSKAEAEEDVDPLDAFMQGVENEVKASTVARVQRTDLQQEEEDDDNLTSFLERSRKTGVQVIDGNNSDDDVYATAKALDDAEEEEEAAQVEHQAKRKGFVLPSVDHSKVEYEPFDKDIYSERGDLSKQTEAEIAEVRKKLNVSCHGVRPVWTV